MRTNELRKKYLEFFKSKGHTFFASDTLVSYDASTLFTSAGMHQFKPYFLGEKKDIKRATSCQKCLRTGDIEEVGKTLFHHTFFEMLGNFSFGDYFKHEAIEYAFEFLTKGLNVKEDMLWFSVYRDDDEAYKIWKDRIGVPVERIVKLDEKSNFWPANAPSLGPNGPCGPCSEIFFDKGKHVGCGSPQCSPACSCGRFVEVWNLVFTQFNRVAEFKLEPLPQKNIDTGMGLERMAAVLQDKESNFEIDILYPIVEFTRQRLEVSAQDPLTKSFLYAIVDHLRAAVFAIADGVHPSNVDQGYVIRKLIRIALWKMTMIEKKKSNQRLKEFPAQYAQLMADFYPYLREKQSLIADVLDSEEEKFIGTLEEGEKRISVLVEGLKKQGKSIIEGQDAFRLYDTYGLPLELSKEYAQSRAMIVDEEGFKACLEKQKELSRKKSMFDTDIFKKGQFSLSETTQFLGYESLSTGVSVLRLFCESAELESLKEGEEGVIVLDKTPFYAESGGQLTDKGTIKTATGQFAVEEVFRVNEAILHRGRVLSGEITKGAATAVVDSARRRALARAHTATHLLQAALRKVLGAHVAQQGSLVDEDTLRFDFTNPKALQPLELEKTEDAVNGFILDASTVDKRTLSLEEAKKQGALAFFKDKYKDVVRVVSIGNYSKELCGGTHCANTAEIGVFVITSESSISSGTRRIEALVGDAAYRYLKNIRTFVKDSAVLLKCSPQELSLCVRRLFDDVKEEKVAKTSLQKQIITLEGKEIIAEKKEINGVPFLAYSFNDKAADVLLYLCDTLKNQNTSLFIFFVSKTAEKDIFICSATNDIIEKGFSCDKFVAQYKEELLLRGGGRKNLVQGVVMQRSDNYLEKIRECFLKFTNR